MTSPADELRAAAKILRCDHDFKTEPRPGVVRYDSCKHCGRPWAVGDRVSAEVAEPLAALLEHVVATWDLYRPIQREHAIEVARALNGGQQS